MVDPAVIELFRQLPISVALLLVLIYFIRTNRQDRHELNLVATKQAETEQLSAENARRLIERTQIMEEGLSGLAARLAALSGNTESLTALNKTLVARLEQTAEIAGRIRSREEAKLDAQDTVDKLTGVVKDTAKPILDAVNIHLGEKDLTLRKLESIHTTVTNHHQAIAAIPPHLDALKVKMDEMPILVRQEYTALLAENKALSERAVQAEAEAVLYKTQLGTLTAEAMAKDNRVGDLERQVAGLQAQLASKPVANETASPPSDKPDAPPEGVMG